MTQPKSDDKKKEDSKLIDSTDNTSISERSSKKEHRDKKKGKKEHKKQQDQSLAGLAALLETTKQSFTVEHELNECPMSSVTVFSNQAEITRRISLKVVRGRGRVTIKQLLGTVNSNSIRVSAADKQLVILEVIYDTSFITEDSTSRLTCAKQRKNELNRELAKMQATETRLIKVQRVMDKYVQRVASVTIDTSGLVPPSTFSDDKTNAVASLLANYTAQVALNNQQLRDTRSQLNELQRQLNITKAEIADCGSVKTTETRTVAIELLALDTADVELKLTYVVNNASWKSSYDIRVDSKTTTAEFYYYGEVQQASGEDWSAVELSLSSANPSIDVNPPDVPKINLHFYRPPVPVYYSSISSASSSRSMECMEENECVKSKDLSDSPHDSGGGGAPGAPAPMRVLTAKAQTNSMGGTTFMIPRRATIPCDNVVHKVTIGIVTLTCEFVHVVVPRKSPFAYIRATATNNSVYPLLAGHAKIFFDGSFVAGIDQAPINLSEKFECFLGIDEGVRVKSTPLKRFTEIQGMFNKSRIETIEKNIKISNQKINSITVVVQEQLPRSQDERLKVRLIEPNLEQRDRVKLNEITNIVEWNLTINTDHSVNLPLKYSFECPQDKCAFVAESV